MDIQTEPVADIRGWDGRSLVPPFDPMARGRIEEVAASLLDLVGRLEARLVTAEGRIEELEGAMTQLGLVQVPR